MLFSDHKCGVCGKGYSSKTSLAAHEKTHRADEANKCTICNKEFKQESAFKRHMQLKHPVVPKTEPIADSEIELIKGDPNKPNTYKIICAGNDESQNVENYEIKRNADETIYEIYEFQDDESNDKPIKPTKVSNSPKKPSKSPKLPAKMPTKSPKKPIKLTDAELKSNITRLLKTVVDEETLTKFGYPNAPTEKLLNSVIKQCGQAPIDGSTCSDSSSKLRENVKLLFTSVIDDDSIKEMLNNHSIDEVVCHVIKLSETS